MLRLASYKDRMFDIDPTLLLQAFGLIFLGVGMAARLGVWKKWYWRTKGSMYGYMPLGLMFLLYSFYEPVKERLGTSFWMFQSLFLVLIAIGAWLSLRPPAFIKPTWVRWVEAHPKDVRQAMERAATDDPTWEQHVTSPEAVDAWARTLKFKNPRSKTNPKAKK
jgi:hypothetical protein